ncbi:MAG: AMP-binding protein, partial [Polaromonas sp.]
MSQSHIDSATRQQARRASRNLIGDALQRSVRRNPDKEALRFGSRSWTYAQLDQAANRVAHRLLGLG